VSKYMKIQTKNGIVENWKKGRMEKWNSLRLLREFRVK